MCRWEYSAAGEIRRHLMLDCRQFLPRILRGPLGHVLYDFEVTGHLETWKVSLTLVPSTYHRMLFAFPARASFLWGHAPRVRAAVVVRRRFATVVDRSTKYYYRGRMHTDRR